MSIGHQIAIATLMVSILIVGCSAAGEIPGTSYRGSDTEPSPTPFAEPTPSIASVRSDAEMLALVRASIDTFYCGTEPVAAWCSSLHLVNGQPDVTTDGSGLFVNVDLAETTAGAVLAAGLCRDIADRSFDDNAKPIGYTHIHVRSAQDPGPSFAYCDVQ